MNIRLKHKDLIAVVSGLRELQGFDAGANLAQRMVKIAGDLVPCETVTYGKWTVDAEGKPREYRFLQQPAIEKFEERLPVLFAHVNEHPLFQPMLQQTEGPLRISDLVTPRQFFKTTLYNEFYRPLGIQHQMFATLPKLPDARVFMLFNRHDRNFSDRDRRILELLVPHFRQAHNHAWAQASIQHRNEGQKPSTSGGEPELVQLAPDLKIQQISDRSLHWLQNYFPGDCRGGVLPETLAAWIKCQTWNQVPGEDRLAPPQAMLVKTQTGMLDVTCLPHPDGSARLLLTETLLDPLTSISRGTPLTPREQEVYHWMCEGKTYPETAIILGMKPRTVHKHVERIFRKLGVENRLQAERLGWQMPTQ